MDLKILCDKTCGIVKEVGSFIRKQKQCITPKNIEVKGLHDFVTYVDKTSEKQLIGELCKILPQAGFIAEEKTTKQSNKKLQWIIDPLDGTTNFIHALPPYAISVALVENKKTILGVVYEITNDECFYSWGNMTAFCNNHKIKVSKACKIKDSLIATGFPYYDFTRLEEYMKAMDVFMHTSHGVRRLGSAATDLCYVACGRFEAFFEYGLSPWDVAAGAFIVEQAGGVVSDFNRKKNYIFGAELIASNKNVFNDFYKIVNSCFNNSK